MSDHVPMSSSLYLSFFCFNSSITCWFKVDKIRRIVEDNLVIRNWATPPINDTVSIGRHQLPGNFLYVLVGLIGIAGNLTIMYIYLTRPRFHYKSYYLLIALAYADLISCIGFSMLGCFRIAQYYSCKNDERKCLELLSGGRHWSHVNAPTCLAVIFPTIMGYLTSVCMDFLISADRLFSIIRPVYHTINLGNNYVYGLIILAYAKGITEYGLYNIGMNQSDSTWNILPVCTLQDPRERNCILLAGDLLNITLIIGTVLNYLLTIPAARFQLRSAIRELESLNQTGEECRRKYVQRCLRKERAIFRTAAVIGTSFLISSLPTFVASEIVACRDRTIEDDWTPYIYVFMCIDNADTIFITMWRDKYFKREVLALWKTFHRKLCRRSTSYQVQCRSVSRKAEPEPDFHNRSLSHPNCSFIIS